MTRHLLAALAGLVAGWVVGWLAGGPQPLEDAARHGVIGDVPLATSARPRIERSQSPERQDRAGDAEREAATLQAEIEAIEALGALLEIDGIGWDDTVPDAARPEAVASLFDAVLSVGEVVEALDCEAYPCVAVVRKGDGAPLGTKIRAVLTEPHLGLPSVRLTSGGEYLEAVAVTGGDLSAEDPYVEQRILDVLYASGALHGLQRVDPWGPEADAPLALPTWD